MSSQIDNAHVFAGGGIPAIEAASAERLEFIRKTYVHLGVAVLAFVALTAMIVRSPVAVHMLNWIGAGQYNWLLVLGAFMLVGWFAERWAQNSTSPATQYLGLGLYIVAEAFIFTPLLYIAVYFTDGNVLPTAALLTILVFVGLTGAVLVTGKDFSFMRGALVLCGLVALGLIVASIVFGFTLGTIFSGAMVLLAAGYVLYYTSNVLHHYPVGSHVAAALALFSAMALLFWYILRLLMALNRR